MHQTQHQIYCSLVDHVAEEPVREVLKGIWSLPFVADTGESCSGHVIKQRDLHTPYYAPRTNSSQINLEKSWYRKNPHFDIFYFLDQNLVEERDRFREELKSIKLNSDYGVLQFDHVSNHISSGDHSSGSAAGFSLPEEFRLKGQYLHESYHSTFVMEEKTINAVANTEKLFAQFWDEITTIIKQFNPTIELKSAVGTDFRHSINWSNWKCTHWPAFLPPEQQAAYRRLLEQVEW